MIQRVLIVEDDKTLSKTLAEALLKLPAEVETVFGLREATKIIKKRRFDLILLDRHLPDGDGMDLLDGWQDKFNGARVLMITTADLQYEVEEGLAAGADDYLAKPFSWNELMLRARNLLRSRKVLESDVFRVGTATFYANTNRLIDRGREARLRSKEARLLKYFCEHPNAVIRDEDLLKTFWARAVAVDEHIVNVYVARLRKHLGEWGRCLQTVHKAGYRLLLASN
jgi:DNA-binding response OmpR family regulator